MTHFSHAVIATDVTVHLDSRGQLRSNHPAGAYHVWAPYVQAFGRVEVVARHDTAPVLLDDGVLIEGPGLSVKLVPNYRGIGGLVTSLPRLVAAFAKVGEKKAIFVGRLPEPLSLLLYLRSVFLRSTFLPVVASEPFSLVVSSKLFPRPFGHVIARVLRYAVRHIVVRASAVVYVSREWLQQIYPSDPDARVIARSNVRLTSEDFVSDRRVRDYSGRIRLISVGSMSSDTKGFDFLLDVIARLATDSSADISLTLVGSGPLKERLMREVSRCNLPVVFVGQLHSREEMRLALDRSDVYVSGSRSEGLSRAMVEAMARGLPVITTDAGAVSELVHPDCIVGVDDLEQFVLAVQAVLVPARYEVNSTLNIDTAAKVAEMATDARFISFLKEVTPRA